MSVRKIWEVGKGVRELREVVGIEILREMGWGNLLHG